MSARSSRPAWTTRRSIVKPGVNMSGRARGSGRRTQRGAKGRSADGGAGREKLAPVQGARTARNRDLRLWRPPLHTTQRRHRGRSWRFADVGGGSIMVYMKPRGFTRRVEQRDGRAPT